MNITVLTSCYNSSKYIETSIKSILSQTFRDFEYIIIDDGSTDNSLSIIKDYANKDSRIRVIEKSNTGLTDSLNIGINEAKGEWIARLDADDISVNIRLEKQLNFVKNNPAAYLVGSGCYIIDGEGEIKNKYLYPSDHNKLTKNLEYDLSFFPHSSAFFNRAIIKELGGYNNYFTRAQDKDLWFRITEKGNIACINEPLIRLRKHDDMISLDDKGLKQFKMNVYAMVCHFLRIQNKKDPSHMEKETWEFFKCRVDDFLSNDLFTSYQIKKIQLKTFSVKNKYKYFTYLHNLIKNPYILNKLFYCFNIKHPAYNFAKNFNIEDFCIKS